MMLAVDIFYDRHSARDNQYDSYHSYKYHLIALIPSLLLLGMSDTVQVVQVTDYNVQGNIDNVTVPGRVTSSQAGQEVDFKPSTNHIT